jgi:hypothetical protein
MAIALGGQNKNALQASCPFAGAVAVNDFAICYLWWDGNTSMSVPTDDAGLGTWNVLSPRIYRAGSNISVQGWYVNVGTAGGGPTVSVGNATDNWAIAVATFTGCARTSPIDGSKTAASNSTTHSTLSASCLLLAADTQDAAAGKGSGFDDGFECSVGTTSPDWLFWEYQLNAGAAGSKTVAITGSANAAMTVASVKIFTASAGLIVPAHRRFPRSVLRF